MASTTEKQTTESLESLPPSKPSRPPPDGPPPPMNFFMVDFALRLLLFATTITSVLVMVTNKQTKTILLGPFRISKAAKFTQTPALIYFVAALSVACLYSILTILATLAAILKPSLSNKRLLLLLASIDTIMLGVVASAMGASASVGYLGLKGNTHAGWIKVCNVYDKFCQHLGSSIAISLISTIILILLILLSTYSLYCRSL